MLDVSHEQGCLHCEFTIFVVFAQCVQLIFRT